MLKKLRAMMEALAGLDANIIATMGPGNDPRLLPVQPEQVHVERYIPQSLVLPRCNLVVSHGGSGTMLAALRHGLPMLLVPRGGDQFDNAERCTALGVARRLLPSEATGDRVRTMPTMLPRVDFTWLPFPSPSRALDNLLHSEVTASVLSAG